MLLMVKKTAKETSHGIASQRKTHPEGARDPGLPHGGRRPGRRVGPADGRIACRILAEGAASPTVKSRKRLSPGMLIAEVKIRGNATPHMDKMREIAGNGALMPRFDDGMANMTEPIRVMTESFVNKIMDTRGDEARELQPAQRLPRAQARHQRRHHRPQGPEAAPCSYFPEDLIERYSRVDRAVIAAVSEMAADGVSTRKVKRVAQSVGMGRTSASRVSRMCSSLDESLADLRERDRRTSSTPTRTPRGGATSCT